MRLFFGIFPPPEIISAVVKLQPSLAKIYGKFVELKNLHLTLIFLPDVGKDRLNELFEIGERVAINNKPFQMRFQNTEAIPPGANARIVNIGLNNSVAFTELQKSIATVLTQEGINFESYHPPHLTLIRIKQEVKAPLPKFGPIDAVINEFSIIESQLSVAGPSYTVLKTYNLEKIEEKYRPNVSICLINDKGEALVVKNAELKGDHWQLPQGGIDDDTPETAALRELREETGITSAKIIKRGSFKFKYKFPAHHLFDNIYIGQEQTPVFIRFTGTNDEIKLDLREVNDFKWVKIDDLVHTVAAVRREFTQKVLDELKEIKLNND